MNLISAELRRLFARRFTRLMLIVVLLIMAVVATGIGYSSHKHTAASLAQAQVQVDQIKAENLAQQKECEASQADPNSSDASKFPPGFPCDQFTQYSPTADDLQPFQVSFRDMAPAMVLILGGLLALLGFAIGASFVGAEWNSGGMMNLLLWRPRRIPTLVGKLTSLLLGVFSVSVVYSAVWLGATWGMASLRGTTEKVTPGVWRSLALDDLRAVGLALIMAALGFAIASVGRHTATALGVAVGYVVVFEIGLRIVLGIAQVARPERFFLSSYVAGFLSKAVWFDDYTPCGKVNFTGNCQPLHWAVHQNQGLAVFGVALVLVLGWALWAIRRRDIT